MSLTLGIDTGGTFTDAVVLDKGRVLASAKAPTTHERLVAGVAAAIDGLSHLTDVGLVCLSTTLATNALVEGKGGRVAAILVGYGERDMKLPVFRSVVESGPYAFVAGGHDEVGTRVQALDEDAIRAFVGSTRNQVDAYAVSGYFATRNPEHEDRAREICRELSGLPVSCGHDLSSGLDAPRRAVTAVVNGRLISLIDRLIVDVQQALGDRGILAPVMVVTGSGSLLPARLARLTPVETILSGPAAGVVGACFLTATDKAVVVDMGGTTTDVSLVSDGRALPDPRGAVVGGISTMVEALRVHTVGLGGDSEIRRYDGERHVGPRRVIPFCRLAPGNGTAASSPADLRYLVGDGAQEAAEGSASLEAALRRATATGPLAWPAVVEMAGAVVAAERAVERLVASGRAWLSGATPTDALVALGRLNLGDAAHARRAMAISSAVEGFGGADHAVEPYALSILESVARKAAGVILAAVLEHEYGSESADPEAVADLCTGPGAEEYGRIRGTLSVPIVGIGAPAASLLPAAAEILGAEFVVPKHAEVASAVGAAVARVHREVRITVSNLGDDEAFRVHGRQATRDFEELHEAVEAARIEASEAARDLALASDVDPEGLQVFLAEHRQEVQMNDRILTLAVEVQAEAVGNARASLSVVPPDAIL